MFVVTGIFCSCYVSCQRQNFCKAKYSCYSHNALNQALEGQHVKRNKIFILYHSYTEFKLHRVVPAVNIPLPSPAPIIKD